LIHISNTKKEEAFYYQENPEYVKSIDKNKLRFVALADDGVFDNAKPVTEEENKKANRLWAEITGQDEEK